MRHWRFGKDTWKSCGTSDKKLALDILKKIESEDERLSQGLEVPRRIKPITFEDFIDLYVRDRVNRLAPRTIQTDLAKLKIFADFLKDSKTLISLVRTRDVEKFREARLKSVKPATVNISLATLRPASHGLRSMGIRSGIPSPRRTSRLDWTIRYLAP